MKNQWQTFENSVDYVIPLTVRSVDLNHTQECNIHDLSDNLTSSKLQQRQKNDPDIAVLLKWINSSHNPSQQELSLSSPSVKYFWSCKSQLFVKDDTLFYLWEDPVAPRYLFVAPQSMHEEILSHCHDDPISGHLGQTKTLERLKNCAIWHKMSQTCKLYVSSCAVCNKNKGANVKAKSSLGQYHAGAPMQRVHMDILGPLPLTQKGNKYILMIVDQFTKWIENNCHDWWLSGFLENAYPWDKNPSEESFCDFYVYEKEKEKEKEYDIHTN